MVTNLFLSLLLSATSQFDERTDMAVMPMQARSSQLASDNVNRAIKGLASPKSEIRDQSQAKLLEVAKVSMDTRRQVIRAVMMLVDDPDARYGTWSAAAGILGELKSTEAVDSLVKHLDRSDGVIGLSSSHFPALQAVINIGQPSVPKLVKALFESTPPIRQLAAQALGTIGGNEAKDALGRALKIEKDGDVIRSIQIALSSSQRK